MKDLGLNKGLKNLKRLRQKLVAIPDHFAGFEAVAERSPGLPVSADSLTGHGLQNRQHQDSR
jgi:hypothetical protein